MVAQRPRAGRGEVAGEEAGGAAAVQATQRMDGARGQAAQTRALGRRSGPLKYPG